MRTGVIKFRSVAACGVMPALCVAVLLIVAGCTKKNPALSCVNGQCGDPRFPFCDINGAVGGDPGTCIAVSCTPGAFAACDGDNELVCNSSGTNYEPMHCLSGCSADVAGCKPCLPNMTSCGDHEIVSCDGSGNEATQMCPGGCVDDPEPHCGYVDPHYLPGFCDSPATASLQVNANQTIDTAMDADCSGGIAPQANGPGICVARYTTFSIASAAKLSVVNTSQANPTGNVNNRPLAIVVDNDLVIDGTLEAGAHGESSGPGGGYSMAGGNDFNNGTYGLGGAGFATSGGNGGSYQADGGAQNAGPQLPNPLSSAVFLGGAKNLGGGGGGVMLVSCRGAVKIAGTVNVGGGGGPSGYLAFCTPGFGGGAGGDVFIEALAISITGALYANGGGGGAGCVPNTQMAPEEDGQDASLSDVTPALGGLAVTGAGGGGKGGIGTSTPGDGRVGQMNVGHPGGGGGSVGWLQTSTPDGISPTLTPAHVSPPLQPNATSATK